MAKHRKRFPAWLLGLVLSVFIFAIALLLFSLLGFGDDPVIGSLGVAFG